MCSDSQKYATARSLALPFSFSAFCFFFFFSDFPSSLFSRCDGCLSLSCLLFVSWNKHKLILFDEGSVLYWKWPRTKKTKKQKTGDNMKTTDKQEKRTKVFFFYYLLFAGCYPCSGEYVHVCEFKNRFIQTMTSERCKLNNFPEPKVTTCCCCEVQNLKRKCKRIVSFERKPEWLLKFRLPTGFFGQKVVFWY